MRTHKPQNKIQGFTLLEILLVVLIIGIMTTVGANLINSQSIERLIMKQAQQFVADLHYVCDKAVLDNQAFGIELTASGYIVSRYQQPQWVTVENQPEIKHNDVISLELMLDGFAQNLTAEGEGLPHIICQTDGSFNPFELRFFDATLGTNHADKSYYQLITESPWQVTGGWHQP